MMGGGMGGFGSFGSFGGLGFLGAIINLVIAIGVIIGIVLLVVWLARRFSPGLQGTPPSFGQPETRPSPQEILQARYARGELSREEFQQIQADLR